MAHGPLFTQLQRMFTEMVLAKDASKIDEFYDDEFLLISNGITQDHEEFVRFHREAFDTDISYAFRYDEDAVVEDGDRLGFRVFIELSWPDQPAREIEVIGIARYRDRRMHRLWELTFPDWSQEDALQL